jgi:hypothetical protein
VSNSSVADRAVEQARNRLADRAATVFHYGAVDIDPKHLVVWVSAVGQSGSPGGGARRAVANDHRDIAHRAATRMARGAVRPPMTACAMI